METSRQTLHVLQASAVNKDAGRPVQVHGGNFCILSEPFYNRILVYLLGMHDLVFRDVEKPYYDIIFFFFF